MMKHLVIMMTLFPLGKKERFSVQNDDWVYNKLLDSSIVVRC